MSVQPEETEPNSDSYGVGQPEVPSGGPGVGPEVAPPDDYDSGPREEDGPQDVDQFPDFESAESDDNQDNDDPEVHEV